MHGCLHCFAIRSKFDMPFGAFFRLPTNQAQFSKKVRVSDARNRVPQKVWSACRGRRRGCTRPRARPGRGPTPPSANRVASGGRSAFSHRGARRVPARGGSGAGHTSAGAARVRQVSPRRCCSGACRRGSRAEQAGRRGLRRTHAPPGSPSKWNPASAVPDRSGAGGASNPAGPLQRRRSFESGRSALAQAEIDSRPPWEPAREV